MHILSPYFSCAVDPLNPAEFQQALEEGYSQIYVFSVDGLMLYRRLHGGVPSNPRYVVSKVSSLPNCSVSTLQAGINFLPDGKVPMGLFYSIVKFFKDVCEKYKTNLEAQIWVLWNEERGYYLFVPEQAVTAGSVTYDWSQLPHDSVLVVDFHSHGGMSAFFSGTDDNDDSNAVRYSGVIGKANTSTPEYVLRFNNFKEKVACTLEEVFGHHVQVETDPEWMSKITHKVPVYQTGRPRADLLDEYYAGIDWKGWVSGGPPAPRKPGRTARTRSRETSISSNGAEILNQLRADEGSIPQEESLQMDDSGYLSGSEHSRNSRVFGPKAACAVVDVGEGMVDLEGHPELLGPLLADGVKLLPSEARLDLIKDIVASLPEAQAATIKG